MKIWQKNPYTFY